MATYVLVSTDEYDKTIKGGPLELDDPSQYPVPEGEQLMLLSDAEQQGYTFAAGGAAVAADQPTSGADTSVQDTEDEGTEDQAVADQGGRFDRGPQGVQGGQGSQVQPGVQPGQTQQ